MIKHNDRQLLEMAVEITKEYARSGGQTPINVVIKTTYEELTKINESIDEENE